MLYAKNEEGHLIVLAHLSEFEKEALRKKNFYCPACQKHMQLRKGKVKTWYFAHVSSSRKKQQAIKRRGVVESSLHLDGKEALYRWIQKDTALVQKEFVRKEVSQRPDVYCVYKETAFAVEYQCATLDVESLRKRTELHIQSLDEPIWIVGRENDSQIKQGKFAFESLMYFQDLYSVLPVAYIFERPFTHLSVYMPIATFSPRKILYATIFLSKHIPFFKAIQITPLHYPFESMKKDWQHEKRKYRLSNQTNPTQLLKYLFTFFPKYQLTFLMLPTTVGVPVLYSYHLYSHSVEWQLWFQLCILKPMEKNERISLSSIKKKWCAMIQKGYIIVRPLPLIYKTNHFDALKAYILFLEEVGMLTVEKGYIQKAKVEQRLNHVEDILLADKNILNFAFMHLKSQLKLMVEKNKKG